MEPLKPPRRTVLYRFFNTDGELLYIGIAGNPGRRFEQHDSEKEWAHTIAYSRLEHYASREEAAAAERIAIHNENPRHNIVGNRTRSQPMSEESVTRHDRMSQVLDAPLQPGSLVGSLFYSDAARGWQGCVVAEPAPGMYLVELFSWSTDDSTNQVLIPLTDMFDWKFYDDARWMSNHYQASVSYQWKRVEAGRNTESA